MKNRRLLVSIMAGILAVLMVLTLIISTLPLRANAKSSSEIRQEIEELEAKAEEIQKEKDDLSAQIEQNRSQTEDIVAQKDAIDDEIKLLSDEIENNNAQIQAYNLLISEKQDELDDALERQAELNEEYKVRLRAMEENGKVSYWSILFKASSFLDLLDQINMIGEIADRDQRMLEEIDAVAQEIADAQTELEADKADLETAKEALEKSEAELDQKRAESDAILKKLVEDAEVLRAMFQEMAEQEKALSDDIAAREQDYNEQKAKEDAANRPSNGNGNPGSNTGNGGSGFIWPVYAPITSAYGWRTDPVYGYQAFHSGIDLGAGLGTPIAASKGGTVTTAEKSSVWGYYVVINHGDGSSTLYAHMTNYVVSVGESVSQGQTIGYVGSTGKSTGPHLHFNIYLNGETVNPVAYLP